MIGPWGRSRGARVAAKGVDEIRRIALRSRAILQVEEPRINMVRLFEWRLRRRGIQPHVVDADSIKGDAARADIEQIRITLEAYLALTDGDPAYELLVPHEFGHIALGHANSVYFSREASWYVHDSIEDSEAQADRFSHEFAMPIDLVRAHCRSLDSIREVFNVPYQDARIRMTQLQQERAIDW